MGDGAYNGFHVKYRMSQSARVNSAIKRGLVERPEKCLTCCQTEGIIMGHQEDYDFPYAYFPVCYVCHRMIHQRFKRPELYLRYRAALRLGYRSEPFTFYGWRLWNSRFKNEDWETWTGSWGNELGDQTLLRMLPMQDFQTIPDGLRCSQGDGLIVSQYVPIDDLWPESARTTKLSASTP